MKKHERRLITTERRKFEDIWIQKDFKIKRYISSERRTSGNPTSCRM